MKFKERPYIATLWEKTTVSLAFPKANIKEIEALFGNIEQDVEYDIKISKKRKNRSLDANAYAWVLLRELSKVLKISPEEVYRQQILDMFTYRDVLIKAEDLEKEKIEWEKDHLGRSLKIIGESRKHDGWVWCRKYRSSSDFDSAEMSQFIDNLLYECDNLGIFINDREEIEKSKEEW